MPSSLLSRLREIKGCSEVNKSGLMRTLVIVFLLRLDGRAAATGEVVSWVGGGGPDRGTLPGMPGVGESWKGANGFQTLISKESHNEPLEEGPQ